MDWLRLQDCVQLIQLSSFPSFNVLKSIINDDNIADALSVRDTMLAQAWGDEWNIRPALKETCSLQKVQTPV